LEKNLLKLKFATQAALDKVKAEAREKVEVAVQFAEGSPQPDPGELLTDVYAD
jgi:pyruvate dehydrogenase E1 component alpha subunit